MKEKKDINVVISDILKTGVYIGTAFILVGIALVFIHNEGSNLALEHYSFIEMLKGITRLDYYAYLMFGIFILILTPILRILGLLVIYFIEKDYKFVRICVIVLLILCISLILGVTHN